MYDGTCDWAIIYRKGICWYVMGWLKDWWGGPGRRVNDSGRKGARCLRVVWLSSHRHVVRLRNVSVLDPFLFLSLAASHTHRNVVAPHDQRTSQCFPYSTAQCSRKSETLCKWCLVLLGLYLLCLHLIEIVSPVERWDSLRWLQDDLALAHTNAPYKPNYIE